jgi:hypothetical protein
MPLAAPPGVGNGGDQNNFESYSIGPGLSPARWLIRPAVDRALPFARDRCASSASKHVLLSGWAKRRDRKQGVKSQSTRAMSPGSMLPVTIPPF